MKKVLIVEDEEIHKLLAVKILNELGFLSNEISLASDGLEALEFIRICHKRGDATPNLILLDLDMPTGNGFEFLQGFNSLPMQKKPQIIITSCSTDIDEIERASKLGAYQYITKPLRKEVLESMIKSHLENALPESFQNER
jgi:two-component system response regulator